VPPMPVRATKRGAQRTPLAGGWDVVVCGASFAGLAVCRELATGSSRARVLLLDRYEVGERQTSACAAPTAWLEWLGVGASVRQTFSSMVVHTPHRSFRWRLPWTWSTFDYRELCLGLLAQCDATFETATVRGRAGDVVRTDRGEVSAPLLVDALGWRRVLSHGPVVQPPQARLSRGLEVHPGARREDMELWLDPSLVRAGYGWSFPAGDEARVGVGSFRPRDRVRVPTERLAASLGLPAEGWQGSWIPHALRDAVEDGVAFCGDSAGHCLATTAEGIRPAFFFGGLLGRELRAVLEGAATRGQALRRYRAAHERLRWKYAGMKALQDGICAVLAGPGLRPLGRAAASQRFADWGWRHYGRIAPVPAAA
jgi:menaquinone-9 beta-reductase